MHSILDTNAVLRSATLEMMSQLLPLIFYKESLLVVTKCPVSYQYYYIQLYQGNVSTELRERPM